MRILVFSDWRVQNLEFALHVTEEIKPDIVLYAGDDVTRFNSPDTEINYFEEISRRSHYGLGAIIGNDCHPSHREFIYGQNVHELHSNPWDIMGWRVVGLEGGTTEVETPIGHTMYSGDEIHKHLEEQTGAVSGESLIIVSHVPPAGCLDVARRFGIKSSGSKALRRFIEKHRPPLVICGHVHLQGGKYENLGNTVVLNIASHDEVGATACLALVNLDKEGVHCEVFDEKQLTIQVVNEIGPVTQRELEKYDITKIEQLLEPEYQTIVAAIGGKRSHRWIEHAKAIQTNSIRVFSQIKIPEKSLYVDIETDLLGRAIWLIGTYMECLGFRQFFNKTNPRDTSRVISEFSSYTQEVHPDAILSYSSFDPSRLRAALNQEQRSFFQCIPQIDILTEIRRSAYFPFAGHKLFQIASYLGYPFQHPELDGLEVGTLYSLYLDKGIEPHWQELLEYNRDDVMSMIYVVEKVNEKYLSYGAEQLSPAIVELRKYIDRIDMEELRKEVHKARQARWEEKKRRPLEFRKRLHQRHNA